MYVNETTTTTNAKEKDMAKATLKKVNDYLQSQTPELELVKGEGYFYFVDTLTDDEIKNWFDGFYENPDSIYVCHLCHLTLERWQEVIDGAVKQYHHDNPTKNTVAINYGFRCSFNF